MHVSFLTYSPRSIELTFHCTICNDLTVFIFFFKNKNLAYFVKILIIFMSSFFLKKKDCSENFLHFICMTITVFNCSISVVIHNNGLQYPLQLANTFWEYNVFLFLVYNNAFSKSLMK